jgi:hypothetical protein
LGLDACPTTGHSFHVSWDRPRNGYREEGARNAVQLLGNRGGGGIRTLDLRIMSPAGTAELPYSAKWDTGGPVPLRDLSCPRLLHGTGVSRPGLAQQRVGVLVPLESGEAVNPACPRFC